MTTIAIFGVGLIGGSLALCFKGKAGLRVVGYSNRQSSADKYVARGVVDAATTSVEEAASDADYIFLCVPVGKLDEYLQQLAAMKLKPGCIITDVGSTKASVAACARSIGLQDGAVFIGGHPMAGGERSGVEAANEMLFENAFYVLTPEPDAPEEAVERLTALLAHTRAQIVRLEPTLHDEIVGAISHLPHVIAVQLVNQVRHYNESNSLYQALAAGGFRDITRIASSDPVMWRDVLIDNREVVIRLLQEWRDGTDRFISLLEQGNEAEIEEAFRTSGEFRSQFPERRKGAIGALYECYIDVPDHPGIIGRIATELGNARINLSNLQIIESREDVPGILRLSFRAQDDLDRAMLLLSGLGFEAKR
jgi:prephenate dehydrogenase